MKRIGIFAILALMAGLPACYYYGPCVNGSGPIVSETRQIIEFNGVHNTGSFEVIVSEADTFGVVVEAQENLLPIIETYVSGYTLMIKTRNNNCFRSDVPVKIYVSLPQLELLRLSGSGEVLADVAEGLEVEVSNSGSGFVELDSAYAAELFIGNTGSGTVSMEGARAPEVEIRQSGSGSIFAGELEQSDDVDIKHNSSGNITAAIFGGRILDVDMSGSGQVDLTGDVLDAIYTLNSSGRIDALDLEAIEADATVSGSGEIYVWARDYLQARITSSGDIYYRGNPMLDVNISGSGKIRAY